MPNPHQHPQTRRHFMQCACTLAASLMGCARDANELTSPDNEVDGVTFIEQSLRIDLTRTPALNKAEGSLVVSSAHVIVIRTTPAEFRAFSNICTHAGCGIYVYRDARLQCQCHGSEFNNDGTNVAGPAPAPLRRFPVRLVDDTMLLIDLS